MMPQQRRRGWLAGLAALALAQPGDAPAILRPMDHSIVEAGPLTVIARTTGELRLDGQLLNTAEPAPGIRTATATLTPGRHQVQSGDHKADIFAGPGAPAGFRPYRLHPPGGAACDTCHVLRQGAWEFKGASTSCLGCHDQKKFPAGHTHNSEVLAECGLCHDAHGSTEKLHLKVSREVACKLCHG